LYFQGQKEFLNLKKLKEKHSVIMYTLNKNKNAYKVTSYKRKKTKKKMDNKQQ